MQRPATDFAALLAGQHPPTAFPGGIPMPVTTRQQQPLPQQPLPQQPLPQQALPQQPQQQPREVPRRRADAESDCPSVVLTEDLGSSVPDDLGSVSSGGSRKRNITLDAGPRKRRAAPAAKNVRNVMTF
jgi:hypothetical protein